MTTTTLENIIAQTRAKQAGANQWSGHCPAHEDKKSSFSIGVNNDGAILLRCHAGCDIGDILGGLGLKEADLFPKPERVSSRGQIQTTYDYVDSKGKLLYQAVRLEGKRFFQRRPDGAGGWHDNLKGISRTLYHLPDVLAAGPGDWVFICEGEKSTDAIRGLGLVATTNSGGAGKWQDSLNEHLRGRKVIILPDNDNVGLAHAQDVLKSLKDVVAEVRVIGLPGLAYKDDPGDWVARGGDKAGLLALITRPEYKTRWTMAELLATEFPEPQWAVPGIVPVGLSVLAGRPKVGKSWLALQIAHAVGTGGMVLDQQIEQGKVLFLALEDSPRRLKERSFKQGALPHTTVTFATAWPLLTEGGLADLQAEIEREGYSLVIIDTFARAAGRVDHSDQGEMTTILGNLQRMAQIHELAILLVDHHRKTIGFEGNPIDDIIGSTAKAAVADAALGLFKEQGKRGAILKITGRDIEETDLAVEWDGALCCWQLLGEAGRVRKDSFKADILAAIRDLTDIGETPSTANIARHLDKSRGHISRALADLLNTGEVVKGKKEGKIQPYLLPLDL